MTIRPIITTAASDQQREEAELTALSSFVTGYEGWLAASRAFANQDDIDPVALASGVVAIHARAKTGFDAGTYLELQGTRSPGGLTFWEEVLLAALATHIGFAEEVPPGDLDTARRLGLA
ncbi:hypothetical protein AX289_32310 [Methylorubrum populi]|nr:hypothetical protein AX289_32310 [Methylorubrum populi]